MKVIYLLTVRTNEDYLSFDCSYWWRLFIFWLLVLMKVIYLLTVRTDECYLSFDCSYWWRLFIFWLFELMKVIYLLTVRTDEGYLSFDCSYWWRLFIFWLFVLMKVIYLLTVRTNEGYFIDACSVLNKTYTYTNCLQSLGLYFCWWTFYPPGIIRSVVRVLALTWFITYIFIIEFVLIKTKLNFPEAKTTKAEFELSCLGPLVSLFSNKLWIIFLLHVYYYQCIDTSTDGPLF